MFRCVVQFWRYPCFVSGWSEFYAFIVGFQYMCITEGDFKFELSADVLNVVVKLLLIESCWSGYEIEVVSQKFILVYGKGIF